MTLTLFCLVYCTLHSIIIVSIVSNHILLEFLVSASLFVYTCVTAVYVCMCYFCHENCLDLLYIVLYTQ